MARDVNLMFLDAVADPYIAQTWTAALKIGAEVECEGGFYALARVKFLTIEAGTTPVLVVTVEASLDGGTTFYSIGQLPDVDNTMDNMEIARPVWVPRPDPAKTTVALGKGVVHVRLWGAVGSGSGHDYDIAWAALEPLVSLGGPAGDLGPTGTIGIFTATTRKGVEELGVVTGA